jgi:hypothetical protein
MLSLAKILVLMGVVFLVLGGLAFLAARLGLVPGRLPGDIRLVSGNLSCVFALGTSLLLSIILTVLLNLVIRWLR